jgi:aminoglycoside phosphotransferase (APT) family kinase protein
MAVMPDRQELFAGTQTVAPHLAFDLGSLASYLRSSLPGFEGPIEASQFKGGQSNPTYEIRSPSGRYVLRRKPPGKLLPSAHAVEREFRVLSALHGQGFPVPRPYLLCEDASIIGTPFHLTAFVDGRIFWEPSAPGLDADERRALFRSLVATLAQLHSFDFEAAGLGDFGKGRDYVRRQIGRWSEQYRASMTEAIPEMDALIAWLPTAVPSQAEVALIHGDFRLDNCIVHAARPDIVAVLDWELSTLGDPIADFTYHLMQWHMPPGAGGVGSLRGREDLPGIPPMEAYIEEYCVQRGLPGIPDVAIYLAYNFFRLAAIFQGIVGRLRDGSAVNANAAMMIRQVKPMAEIAWRLAREAGA